MTVDAGGPPFVRADERRLKQILLNLLSNAIKFTPAGGLVGIRASMTEGGGIAIAVSDTGIGIAAEEIDRAMAPFSQVETGLARRYDGTGLGLPLSKALAELHGGSLHLESEPGVGTTVTVCLPAARVVRR
jgi:signal transduction histidine kinase